MDKESAWEKFKKSGRVLDYLSYRSKPDLMSDDSTNSEDNIYPGVHHENIFKWTNYPRNGFR